MHVNEALSAYTKELDLLYCFIEAILSKFYVYYNSIIQNLKLFLRLVFTLVQNTYIRCIGILRQLLLDVACLFVYYNSP